MRATRPPKRGQRRSLPSEPLTAGRLDCMQVMHGPSSSSSYCSVSMSRTKSVVTDHAWMRRVLMVRGGSA